MQYIIAVCI